MAKVDCWSCRNNPGSWGEDSDIVQRMLFAVDDSPLLAGNAGCAPSFSELNHGAKQQQQYGATGRWQKLQKSVCSYLQSSSSSSSSNSGNSGKARSARDEQRKSAFNGVVESLMQRHPGSQLPERLISMIRRHFESLPSSYALAGLDSEQIFLHMRLIDRARVLDPRKDNPVAVSIQHTLRSSIASDSSASSSPSSTSAASWDDQDEESSNSEQFCVAFASIGLPMSKHSICWAFKRAGIFVKQVQVFDRKSLLLGIVSVLCSREFMQLDRMQSILKSASKKSRLRKLTLGLYGCSSSSSSSSGSSSCCCSCAADHHHHHHHHQQHHHHHHHSSNHLFHDASRRSSNAEPIDENRPSFAANRLSIDGGCSSLSGSLRIRVDRSGNLFGKEDLSQWTLDSTQVKIVEEIGGESDLIRGRFGEESVVLKTIFSADGQDDRDVEIEFHKEVLLSLCCSNGISHRNVVPIRGICFLGRKIWTVSKLLHGGSLRDFLARRSSRIDLKTALGIACDVAAGMQFLHECGIIHSNLKSTNILLDDQGAAVIGGLKMARTFDERGDTTDIDRVNPWPAPEVAGGVDFENSVITPKTDVYSFGIVLWELVASQSTVDRRQQRDELRPVVPVDCFPLLKYLMQQCWTSNPLDRPDFCEILEIVRTATRDLTR